MFELLHNFGGLNKQIFFTINHFTNASIAKYFLQIASWPFSISNFIFYYVIASTYCYHELKKTDKFEKKFTPIFHELVRIGVIYTTFGFTYALLKFTINSPRPFCSLPSDSFQTIQNISGERCLSSFPSAHVGLATLITYFLWSYLSTTKRIFALLIIIIVAISRISLAMHYPADIIYSIFIVFMVIYSGNTTYKLFRDSLIDPIGQFLLKSIKDS